ncbi:MAG: hypothetical protein GY804_04540 [Alphaproteobacteria bacterium]|nr:hypothetical protein [Alphaproteobacteria bacterium]
MAWTKNTVQRGSKSYIVATETLTVATSDAAGEDLTSSVINWIPPGQDFVVISNTGATSLSSDADVDVHVCATSGGTYAVLKADLEAALTNAVYAGVYDISANGEAPFYKLVVDSDGVQLKTDTIGFAVITQNA